jgi:dTDP-4-dehydrorhamnose reductase
VVFAIYSGINHCVDVHARAKEQDQKMNGLIGHSGFVGETLKRQHVFGGTFRSNNANSIAMSEFELLVCSAAPAQKWIANREPQFDRWNIENLITNLKKATCERFVLISTVDVFTSPVGVDEETPVEEYGLHAYGLHRRLLEKFVETHFKNHLIVRLPGLVGPGLRKNVIFDFLNNNNLHAIDGRGVFQFYPMVNLWYDIQIALNAGLRLVHLTAEPVTVADVASQGFNRTFDQALANAPAAYDMRTRYSELFGGTAFYQYSRRESIQAIRAYAQSEPRLKAEGQVS